MTGFNNNNKFIPNTPKTFQVLELRDQQQPVKKSPLSAAAKSKAVNKSGSNYLSPWANTDISEKEGYGPCLKGNCNFSITATLVDRNGNSRSETRQPTSYREVERMANDINFGLGVWEADSGSSFFGTNYFNPSTNARVALASTIGRDFLGCGPQNITAAENSNRRGTMVTTNGISEYWAGM